MDKTTLRKVQLVQLEIAKEVKRVCEKNNIRYFLTAGTLLGAIRHKGFIPWDDDLDIAMLKEDYDRFVEVAPNSFKPEYELQTWHTDNSFPNEFAKVRKKGTLYIEGKAGPEKKVGIYVDIIVYINFPDDEAEIIKTHNKMLALHRLLLMKCKYRPWYDNGAINWKKRIGYLYYQFIALFFSYTQLVKRFETIQNQYPNNTTNLHGMIESRKFSLLKREWYNTVIEVPFEDNVFPIPKGYDGYLTTVYGNYMQLPPKNERENRHQILIVKFEMDESD